MTATFDRDAISRARTIMTALSKAHGYQWIGDDVSEFLRFHDALVEMLEHAIEGWEEGAYSKSSYLREKHGDIEGIASARSLLTTLKEEGE